MTEIYSNISRAHEARIVGVMVLGKTRLADIHCFGANGVSFAAHVLPEAEAIAVIEAKG